jgi:hypothetical protein
MPAKPRTRTPPRPGTEPVAHVLRQLAVGADPLVARWAEKLLSKGETNRK